jgi:hypothetical protein
VTSSVLGLALAAALWWIIFGGADDERAEQVLTSRPCWPWPRRRSGRPLGLAAQVALLTVLLVAMLLAERRWDPEAGSAESTGRGTAG